LVILDTSFLFAYFQENDEFHLKAKELAENIRGELIYVSFLVAQEFLTLLTSRYSSSVAATIYEDLFSEETGIKLIKIDEEFFEETLVLFKKLNPHRFSFVDVSLMVLSKELEAKVLTFDERLEEKLTSA